MDTHTILFHNAIFYYVSCIYDSKAYDYGFIYICSNYGLHLYIVLQLMVRQNRGIKV